MRNARTEAWIGLEERFHAVLVARENDDEIFALVLHHLQENLDGLLPIVPFILLAVEVVGLVDEKYTAHRPLEHLFSFGSGMANILANQVIACHRHQVSFAYIAESMQDCRHAHSDRRLTGAWRAGERHVQCRWPRRQSDAAAHPINQQQSRDFANACLYRL